MPNSDDRAFIERSARLAIVGVVVASVVLVLVWILKAALTPLAAAFVIAYFLDPLIDRFESLRLKRSISIFALLIVFAVVIIGFLVFLLPRLQQEVAALAVQLPRYLDEASRTWIPAIESTLGLKLPGTVNELLAQLRSGSLPLPLEAIQTVLRRVVGFFTSTLGALVGLVLVPVLAYYLLVSFDTVLARLLSLVPPRHRDYVRDRARMVDSLISSFLRGQLLVASCLGVLYAVGFTAIGIDLAIGIGLVAGALALIPYLGNVVAVTAASTLALLKFGVDWHIGAVLGWYAVVQMLEGLILTPRIVGQTVGLHPATVIVALLIGADLFGFLGLLIAVPVAAVVKVFLGELLVAYRESSLYGAEAAEEGPPGA